ncbi:hypothetical protein RCIP0035_00047 [Klebsiella phage RCIP0035]
MDNVENVQNLETTQVENQGGPKIPGLSAPLNAPNIQGVQDAPAPTQQQQGKDSPDPAKIPLDIEALKAALDKGGDSAKEQPQELANTGNPTIDAGVAMLQKVSGLTDSDMVRALGKALEYQDPNLIDTAFIKERFGEHAAYAELLAKAYLEDQVGQAAKAVQEAYDIVGGKGNWEVAAQLFNSKAPEPLRNAARVLANSGELKQAAELVASFCRDMGLIKTQNPMVRGVASNNALSAAEFRAEYTKLRQEAGNRSLASPQFSQRYNDLLARREAGKRVGL